MRALKLLMYRITSDGHFDRPVYSYCSHTRLRAGGGRGRGREAPLLVEADNWGRGRGSGGEQGRRGRHGEGEAACRVNMVMMLHDRTQHLGCFCTYLKQS